MKFVVTLAFLCACLAVSSSSQDPDVVQVSGGAVLGVRDSTLGVRFWKGIPFGESTAGANRFMPPVPRKAWTGTLNCTVFGPGCVSDHHGPDTAPIQSEDCLNINVYVPLNATRQSNGLLPIMVFIYGGGFDEGDNEGPFEMYDGSALARQHGVIVMALNYRLGALGFAVTNEIKGNLALQDQVLALQWVNQNAAVFGGDNMQVTIFGESAGAMSVGLLLVNQKAKGLFQRAIMESNPTDLLFLNKSRAWEYGADFCKLVGCLKGVDKCNTQCLQQANLTTISKAWEKAAGNAIVFITANWGHIEDGFLEFIPTCCDEWVPSEIIPALDSGRFDSSIPVIVGTNTNEAETFIYDGVDFFLPMVAYEWAVDFVFGSFSKQIIDFYKQFHFVDGRDALSRVFTDYWFRCASEKFATNAVNRGADAYVYRFNHILKDSYIFPEFGLPKICVTEVCHASELPLVFRKTAVPAVNFTMTPEEVQLSDVMGTFWTNFAKTGNPNGPGLPVWPKWDPTSRVNIVFNTTVVNEAYKDACDMWDTIGYYH